MSREKLVSLTKYANDIKNKLSASTLPEKQKNRHIQYKEFLERELVAVNKKIDFLKMSTIPDGKK